MTINLLQTSEYKTLIQAHILKTIEYLFQKNQEFAVACEVEHISFSPELPQDILDTFDETILFILSGYTFESATINEEYFTFEAGFGSENIGTTVTIPLLCIKQVILGEHPIVLNMSKHEIVKEKESTSPKSSMEALLNNPENKKLLKKKK